MKHNNERTIKFPSFNKYPYQAGGGNVLLIRYKGYHHIIYTDYYKGGGIFKIYQNSKVLFDTNLNSKSDWTPFTINAVIKITFDDDYGYASITMESDDPKIMFDGINNSSFYIEYLFR